MKKRLVSLFAVMAMVMAFVPVIASAQSNIKLGDYVQMGAYYDEPILWRCVAFDKIAGYDDNSNPIIDSMDTVTEYTDGYLPLMLADKIICLKIFDMRTTANSQTGSHSRDIEGVSSRKEYGSNYWADSNIRSWLNSEADVGNVAWLCGNPPYYSDKVFYSYNNEAGFLTNFTQTEEDALKKVEQKSIVPAPEYENGIYTSGSEPHIRNYDLSTDILTNYDKAYSEQVTDKIFLPDVAQLNTVYNNREILGDDYYIAVPTESAVKNTKYQLTLFQPYQKWDYWLRTPWAVDNVALRVVDMNGDIACCIAEDVATGLRPAFYLSDYTIFASGDGTEENPYIVGSSAITVTLNSEAISFDQNPVIIDGRTLVSMRAIFEALGAEVDWDGETRTVSASKDNTAIHIAIGDNKLYVNDKTAELDVPAQIINERTLVPIRAVSEALGCEVDWDSENKTVIITE